MKTVLASLLLAVVAVQAFNAPMMATRAVKKAKVKATPAVTRAVAATTKKVSLFVRSFVRSLDCERPSPMEMNDSLTHSCTHSS